MTSLFSSAPVRRFLNTRKAASEAGGLEWFTKGADLGREIERIMTRLHNEPFPTNLLFPPPEFLRSDPYTYATDTLVMIIMNKLESDFAETTRRLLLVDGLGYADFLLNKNLYIFSELTKTEGTLLSGAGVEVAKALDTEYDDRAKFLIDLEAATNRFADRLGMTPSNRSAFYANYFKIMADDKLLWLVQYLA